MILGKTNKWRIHLAISMRIRPVILITFSVFCLIWMDNASGNSPPQNVEINGIPEDGRIENPLNATVSFIEPDGDVVSIRWLLDGEEIATGQSVRRYVYPGTYNLTVELNDGNGSVVKMSRILDPIPPPGYGEKPDNRKNDLIFWSIFGAGGIIFALTAAWIWLKKDENIK